LKFLWRIDQHLVAPAAQTISRIAEDLRLAASTFTTEDARSAQTLLDAAFKNDISLEGGVLAHECATLYVPPGADVPKDQQFNR
jgi:hypothetical protein